MTNMHTKMQSKLHGSLAWLFGTLVGCDSGPTSPDDPLSNVTLLGEAVLLAECAADSGKTGDEGWVCPQNVQLQCADSTETKLDVQHPSDVMCGADELVITHDEPLTLGRHEVEVRAKSDQDKVLCTSSVLVERSAALQIVPKALKLWPPNHKLHEINAADCVEIVGACPGEKLHPRFIWASSDEPIDAKGDGHHEPDIMLTKGCEQLALRAERQGPNDGRVYTLGVRVVDEAGEAHEASCTVSVDHDQSGQDARPGPEAYRVELDGSVAGSLDCTDDEAVLR